MGYSIPSALAACLRHPERLVVTVSGDGEFMMNGNELATARQHGAAPLVILMDNGQFGTIRAHQEGSYPGRVSGTQLVNPDFAAIGAAMGAFAARVERADQIAGAVTGACARSATSTVPRCCTSSSTRRCCSPEVAAIACMIAATARCGTVLEVRGRAVTTITAEPGAAT